MRTRVALTVLVTVTLAVVVAGAVATTLRHDPVRLIALTRVLAFVAVGLVITRRHPRHAVAWVLLVAALFSAVFAASDPLSRLGFTDGWDPTLVHVFAVATTMTYPGAFFLPLTVGLLRFPDSRLDGRLWRWTERVALAALTVFPVALGVLGAATSSAQLLGPGAGTYTDWRRPVLAACDGLVGLLVVCLLVTLASLVVRWRRSGPVEHEQIRWVLSAGVVAIVLQAVAVVDGSLPGWSTTTATAVGYTLLAVAVGIAITRYKLYDIDKIVSRTVTYAAVLAVLAGTYVAIVAALAALAPSRFGSLGVAVATLAVVVLAVPLTRRVRRLVDRRFDRARFDAERVLAAFAADVRARAGESDLPAELLAVVARTVQPAHAGLWLVRTG